MEREYINILLEYIKAHYEDPAILKPEFNNEFNILISSEKYDLNISISKPDEEHYLFGKSEYCIDFDFEANRKYRTILSYHGGGCSEPFDLNDFSNVDNFLNEYCKNKEYEKLSMSL